jgi:hypothetical protein
MILGYRMGGNSSNDGIFFDGSEPPGVLCPNCGTCLDHEYAPATIDIHPSQKYDISYTHDLQTLFSARFVTFCRETLHSDEVFKLVKSKTMDLYYMYPSRVLEFDAVKRGVLFEKPCSVCGEYETIIGDLPAFLKINKPIGSGFFRSDLAFADGKSKNPLLFVSTEWKELLATQKFRGLTFEAITDTFP